MVPDVYSEHGGRIGRAALSIWLVISLSWLGSIFTLVQGRIGADITKIHEVRWELMKKEKTRYLFFFISALGYVPCLKIINPTRPTDEVSQ